MEIDFTEYPTRWSQYVGQEPAKRVLQVAAKSARIRRVPLDHVLITHPEPGVGKTALAMLVAKEMGTKCKIVSGKIGKDAARLALSEMNDRDVLLYDEFHQVMDGGKKNAEWLLSYMQDGVIYTPMGAEDYPRVTLVAATTDPAKIPESILSRFPLRPPIEDYTDAEATRIAVIMSGKILHGLPRLRTLDAAVIASAAHNNPRAIRQLLVVLRDMVITDTLEVQKGRYDISQLLEFQGITPDGLDRTAQQYLKALATEFGGSAGVKALEERLMQPGGLATTERTLMDKGYIARTRTGRTLTKDGITRYRALEAS